MAIFLIVMLFAAGGYYWWVNRKPVAAYRPTRDEILILLRKVYGGLNTGLEWNTFISLPIKNDEKLETIRKQCATINETKDFRKDLHEDFIFNQQGMMEIKRIISDLEGYVKSKGREKTEFQITCAQLLEHKMENLGRKFSVWEYKDGLEESFYVGEYKGIKIFIYADGAGIQSPWGSAMYERQDYKSENELTRMLMSKLTEIAANPAVEKS